MYRNMSEDFPKVYDINDLNYVHKSYLIKINTQKILQYACKYNGKFWLTINIKLYIMI